MIPRRCAGLLINITLLFYSSDTVKTMDYSRRQCILREESKSVLEENDIVMEVYDKYSQRSCLFECLARQLEKVETEIFDQGCHLPDRHIS